MQARGRFSKFFRDVIINNVRLILLKNPVLKKKSSNVFF